MGFVYPEKTRITPPAYFSICLLVLLGAAGPAAAQQLPMWTCLDGSIAPMESLLGQDVDCVLYEVDPNLGCGLMCPPMDMELNTATTGSCIGLISSP